MNWSKRLLLVIVFIGLVALFTHNFLHNIFQLGEPKDPNRFKPRVFEDFQMDTQGSINSTLEKMKRDGLWSSYGLIYGYPKPDDLYDRAFALHAKLYGWLYINSTLDLHQFVEKGYFWVSLIFAIVLASFAIFIYREFGIGAFLAFVILINLSDWLVFVGRNMYHVYFLRFWPAVASMLFFRYVVKEKIKLAYFLLIIGLSLLILALCCNEFITNVVLATGVGPVYYGVLYRKGWKQIFRWVFITVFIAGIAVAIGIAAICIQNYLYYKDWSKALIVIHAIINRAYGTYDTTHDWTAPPEISVFQIFEQYLTLPMLSFPFAQNMFPFYHIVLSLYACIVIIFPLTFLSLLDEKYFPKIVTERTKLLALTAATWYALASSLSWAFLMKGHMWHHIHMAGMIFYLPYLPFMYILLGKHFGWLLVQFRDWVENNSWPWLDHKESS